LQAFSNFSHTSIRRTQTCFEREKVPGVPRDSSSEGSVADPRGILEQTDSCRSTEGARMLTKTRNEVRIPLAEWNSLKKNPVFGDLVELLEDRDDLKVAKRSAERA